MVPAAIQNLITGKCSEGLALALASPEDGAIIKFKWLNRAFTDITGYTSSEVLGQRGTILIGPDVEHGVHLSIIERLMNWENFQIEAVNNRKCGEKYFQRMTWTHLTDPDTGDRWWLCSIIDLGKYEDRIALRDHETTSSTRPDPSAEILSKIHHLELENQRLHHLANTVTKNSNEDALTGLANRRYFEIETKAWIARLKEEGEEFAVLYIDLDRFKFVNDTFGHEAGDQLLVKVADILRDLTKQADLVARLGGDEFAILRSLGSSALDISRLADEIVQQTKAPFLCDGKSTSSSASVGVAIAKADTEDPERIVAFADEALYHAKALGKGRWSFFTEEMHKQSVASKKLASDLFLACERQEFIPYFQPIIDAQTGKIVCAETLVRWAHPTRGVLTPAAFLETAENVGILKRVDEIVFAGLKAALSYLDETGVDLPRASINVSSGRLVDPSFIHDIKSSGIAPDRLTIEILESVFLERLGDVARWTIDELGEIGVDIALDDFGTGHASVSGLLEIRPSILKIDRSFIEPVVEDSSKRPLVASIVSIGKSLGMRIIAEGIETEEHAIILRELGCDYLQGFFFGRPKNAEDLREVLLETEGVLWPQAACRSFKTKSDLAG